MDMLVALYRIDGVDARLERVRKQGIHIRRVMAYEFDLVTDWVREHFGAGWAGECTVALSAVPATCHVATLDGEILGFACFDTTANGFFGPTGVDEKARGQGIAAALLVTSFSAMRESGYAYAVIGGTDDSVKGFYEKVCGAVEIADSEPGIYRDRIR